MSSKATTSRNEIFTWAMAHSLLPVEILPGQHDHEPPQLAFATAAEIRGDLRPLAWDQFFALFNVQDLALVYDAGEGNEPSTSFYEIVHNRPKSTAAHPIAQA